MRPERCGADGIDANTLRSYYRKISQRWRYSPLAYFLLFVSFAMAKEGAAERANERWYYSQCGTQRRPLLY